ncbi:AsmA-like C-terminal region-containing protein [Flavobacterium sp.]|uniref:AsmA-like C-terminal region-containing protein n=1 Tax=Flavobacterium sp. TaxID=239 RepID=UPI00121EB82C|nr:AsmA-like C-terminal region-containing protein [Flavobacterium sp.]RZJ71596.1 MAG: membrane assembly protein AsmA [Flavobacterium sp.]
MNARIKTIVLKSLKWLGIGIASILLLLFLIPILFPGQLADQVKAFANKKLKGELNFTEANISFFNHFPSLTVTLEDFSLKGSAPFEKDTLLAADEVSFGINLKRLIFDSQISIDEIYVDNSVVNVMVNKAGQANYNVYVSEDKEPDLDTVSNTSLRLDRIDISHCRLKYDDQSAGILVSAQDFNYLGKGNFDQNVFDLETDADIKNFDFVYNGEPYLQKKNVSAELVTRINTNALTFAFQRNDLKINQLPIDFKGELAILKSGYVIDVRVSSMGSNLKDLFTALPPEYVTWLESSKVKGDIDLLLMFKGRYDAATKRQPSLSFNTRITDGYIEYKDAPFPTSDIDLDFAAVLPALNTDSLSIKLNSLRFKLGKEYFKAFVETKGLDNMLVKADIKGKLDLEALDKSLGLSNLDMKGKLDVNVESNGYYNAAKRLFPKTKGRVLLQNAWLKTEYYPNPISDINFDINALNNDGTLNGTTVVIKPANFTFEGNPFHLDARVSNLDDVIYDVKAKGVIDIGKIYKVFRQKGVDVTGFIKSDVRLKGRQSYATTGKYSKLDNSGTLLIRDIKASMETFPKPFFISEGSFVFDREKMNFKKFLATYGQSDFALNGKLINAINYLFEKRGTLHGDFKLDSKYVNVNEFMALESGTNTDKKPEIEAEKKASPQASGVIVVPTNLDVFLTTNINKVTYDKFNLENIEGTVGVSKGQVLFKGTQLDIIGATLNLDGMYDDASPKKAGFDLRFRARNFDVKRAFNEIEMFKELATSAGKAEGIISVDYKLNGELDANMNPVYPSLEGGGVVTLKAIKIRGLKMFGSISDKTGSDGLNDPDLSRVDIKTNIKNNVIEVERTRMKVAVFRLRFEGKTSFDGQLALRMRLGLPPFGLVGIPIAITGTHEDPKVKVFSKTTEAVKETPFKGNKTIDDSKGNATPAKTLVDKKEASDEKEKSKDEKKSDAKKEEDKKKSDAKKSEDKQ